ncbi:MAG: hypothetical protein H0U35_06750, partial [Sporichthyaceae bacterium]|nr:hypothetical protein [Sporichthyaceae bacterium]
LRAERLRIRARLLASRDDPSAAAAFDAATKALRDLGSPYHLAVGLLDQSEFLQSTDERAAAAVLGTEAVVIARRLHAEPLIQRAGKLVGALAVT